MKPQQTRLTLPADPQLKLEGWGLTDKFAERFWSHVDQSGGPDACWPWKASRFTTGYGCVWLEDRAQKAHRVAWLLTHGPIPSGVRILHHCDNPPCCNPSEAHLFAGSSRDNSLDMVAKGRNGKAGRRKFTESQIIAIRERYAAGDTTLAKLAEEHGVTWVAIHLIVKRKTWKHVA